MHEKSPNGVTVLVAVLLLLPLLYLGSYFSFSRVLERDELYTARRFSWGQVSTMFWPICVMEATFTRTEMDMIVYGWDDKVRTIIRVHSLLV
jgi:hypothetical protein